MPPPLPLKRRPRPVSRPCGSALEALNLLRLGQGNVALLPEPSASIATAGGEFAPLLDLREVWAAAFPEHPDMAAAYFVAVGPTARNPVLRALLRQSFARGYCIWQTTRKAFLPQQPTAMWNLTLCANVCRTGARPCCARHRCSRVKKEEERCCSWCNACGNCRPLQWAALCPTMTSGIWVTMNKPRTMKKTAALQWRLAGCLCFLAAGFMLLPFRWVLSSIATGCQPTVHASSPAPDVCTGCPAKGLLDCVANQVRPQYCRACCTVGRRGKAKCIQKR